MSGFQIPGPTRGKVDDLIAVHGAERLPWGQNAPESAFFELAADKALVCVIYTVNYETATYVYEAREFVRLNDRADFRKRVWMLMDRAQAIELSKFPQSPVIRSEESDPVVSS